MKSRGLCCKPTWV